MPIRVAAQRQALANRYGVEAPNGALFTADPGTTGSATTEVTATGSPAYARKPWGWTAATDNGTVASITGSATFDVPSGTTVTHIGVTVGAVRGTADVRDSFDSVDQVFSSQGTYAVTSTFQQA